MAIKRQNGKLERREFLKKVTAGGALLGSAKVAAAAGKQSAGAPGKKAGRSGPASAPSGSRIDFPRSFTGRHLKMIGFPLGGIGTGVISLGGRGQLRDWEIFNRPDTGNFPEYCFPAIWAQSGSGKPVARILESRIQYPYEGADGLGARNAPGMPRFEEATLSAAYPRARIIFRDKKIPVQVSLEAFNPLVPLDPEASGLPCAVLRYKVHNPGRAPVKVGVAFSVQNMVGDKGRQAAFRREENLVGLLMDNPFLPALDPLKGSMVLGVLGAAEESVTYLRGWKRAQWWDGVLTFWDDFTDDGRLTSDVPAMSPVGSLAVTQAILPERDASVTFLLTWYFPNRTPQRCGWAAVEGDENTVVGNHYCTQFADAWEVARHVARELPALEARMDKFLNVVQSSSLPPAALDAALSNLSTLRTNTSFRTADGEFHGFEGCNEKNGCCHGSCTHVWNYEQATALVFPSLAHSLRESEFLRNTKENGLMGFRSYLPDGKKIWNHAAADGQMGCLMKLYRDWQLSGDTAWLKRLWPQAKKALEFAWIKGGWDENRDGVAEGVQHNTYDVEFYGPNPLCGIWYLGALRAGEEMARAMGDQDSAKEYERLFENGKKWFDANLFNGKYYTQKVEGRARENIADGLTGGAGAANPEAPDYQAGDACLVDQLLGQYMAHVCGLGYLLDEDHVRQTLKSIYKYNYLPSLSEHETFQRTYALNDEGGVLVASYPAGKRPEIPFPYFAEVWTGLEYQFAAHLIFEDMLAEALTVVESARLRHDGEKRNPWNEPECGYHYARAMSSWALLIALNGFHYSAVERALTLTPGTRDAVFRGFWTVPSGWGNFSRRMSARDHRIEIQAQEGSLAVARLTVSGNGKAGRRKFSAKLAGKTIGATLREETGNRYSLALDREIRIAPGQALTVEISS
ncbi:MAG TPA: GH116 family glycosyl-hydrolase [Terriglobia bacterium]|nr:GH116 family glycosyl-hydrolase [Terriglobia bacterium]